MKFVTASIMIGAFSLLSKILGLGRILAFSNRLGLGQEFDIYVAAFRLPDLIFNLLILGTLSVAFIPVLVGYLNKNREEAEKFSSTIFNFTLLVMGVFGVLGFLLSGWFAKIIVPGFSADAQAATASLTRILMLSPVFFSLSSVLTAYLHSFKRFFIAAISPLFYNLSIIAGVIFLYPKFGLPGIAWSVVAGAFLHFLLQFPMGIRLGLKPLRFWDLSQQGVKKFAKLFLPRVFGLELGQISLLATSVLGSYLASGTLAVFYIAYDLETVPVGIFAVSFAIAAFPMLSEFFEKGDMSSFRTFFSRTAVQILFLIIPISVLTILLRAQIVRLIPGALEGTKFTFADTRLTAEALGFFAISLFAQSLVPLLARCFYAMRNTIIPVISGLVAGVINIGLAIILRPLASPYAFAIAFSIAAIAQMLILFIWLRRRLAEFDDEFLYVRTIKICISSIIMAMTAYLTLYLVAPLVNMVAYWGILVQTLSAVAVAAATYLGAGLLVKLPEARGLFGILRSWFAKFTRPVTSAIVNAFTDFR
ncbi:MAG: murein biosynthesis integral membrane protein MurJ [bacterium]|nr:murein biosynthesis integral membrane protein MurJ [bacterium]